MDHVDLAILEQMTGTDSILFAGFDPRVSPERMGRRLGLDPSTIRARIKGWRDSGFMRRWHILPHPGVLDMMHHVSYSKIPALSERQSFMRQASLAEGVVQLFEHVHGWVGIGMYTTTLAAAKRVSDLLSSLPGVTESQPAGLVRISPCVGKMTASDWQVLLALRASPDASMKEIAAAAGISTNTASKRFHSLVDQRSICALPDLDFAKFTGGILIRCYVDMEDGQSPRELTRTVGEMHGPTSFYREIVNEETGGKTAHFMVSLASLALLDDFEADVVGLPAARHVRVTMPRAFTVLSDWLDERLATHVKAAPSA